MLLTYFGVQRQTLVNKAARIQSVEGWEDFAAEEDNAAWYLPIYVSEVPVAKGAHIKDPSLRA